MTLSLMSDSKLKRKAPWWLVVLGVILAPVILAFLLGALVLFLVSTVSLHTIIWVWWCLRGRDILFVYSNSPIWHDYVEQHILPHLGERAVILNWLERKRWRFSLAKMAFYHFGAYRQFNPLGVVFRPFRRSKVFRFWQPFRDYKHGHPEALHKMESDFFGLCRDNRPRYS